MNPIIRTAFILVTAGFLLSACGEDDTPRSADSQPMQEMAEKVTEKAEQAMESTADAMMKNAEDAVENKSEEAPVYIENGVIYQEEIYKDWPYTEAPETGMEGNKNEEAAAPLSEADDSTPAAASTHIINAEARVFKPDILYINPGDTVNWQNMTSHNTVSVDGMIPEGANPWRGALGENLKITLDTEGIYAYVCEPHIGFGMVGVIIVGHPTTLDDVKKYAQENLEGPYRRLLGKLIKIEL